MYKPTKSASENFNQSPLGRSLGVHGEKIQRLALSLLSNPYWNKTGSYKRSLAAMALETGLLFNEIPPLLSLLECLGFCTYKVRSARVYVPLLAQLYQRLLPKKSVIFYRDPAHPYLFNPEENNDAQTSQITCTILDVFEKRFAKQGAGYLTQEKTDARI